MTVFVLWLFVCGSALVSAQSEKKVFEWRGPVLDYTGQEMKVAESTTVNVDKQMMLMNASDADLRQTPVYRSTSLHDFQNNVVALRPLGGRQCFVGAVKNSFDETLNELERRSQEGNPVREHRPMIVDKDSADTGLPKVLKRFCKGRRIIRIVDVPVEQLPEPWIRYPPLYCIWGPVDIYFPLGGPILRERDVPRNIARGRGPFNPFP